MSFRSRSTTTPIAPPRRRSSSLTRSTGTPTTGYASASSGSSRPYSVNYGNLGSSVGYQPQNNYLYGSNQNLRLGGSSALSGSSYYDNGLSNGSSRRNSFGIPSAALTSASSYKSPYKDKYSSHGSQSYLNNAGTNYTSAYKDRYYSPYTSYDNGVTTASLSIPMNGSSGSSAMKRDYTPMRSNLLSTSSNNLGGSNTNLSINDTVASIGRSQSLREHERKSRTRKSKAAVAAAVPDTTVPYDAPPPSSSALSSANRSLSTLSLRSEEGYEVIFVILILRK